GGGEVHAGEGAGVDAVAGHVRDARVAPGPDAALRRAREDAVEGRVHLEGVVVAEEVLKDARAGAMRARMRGWILRVVRRRDEGRPAGDRGGVRVAVVLRFPDGENGPPGYVRGAPSEVPLGAEHGAGCVGHRHGWEREDARRLPARDLARLGDLYRRLDIVVGRVTVEEVGDVRLFHRARRADLRAEPRHLVEARHVGGT